MTNKWLIGYWHCGTKCSRIGLYLPSPSSISTKIVFSVHILMQYYMYIFSIAGEFKMIHIYGMIRQVTLKNCVIMLSWNNPIPCYPVSVSRGCMMTSWNGNSEYLYYWHFVCFYSTGGSWILLTNAQECGASIYALMLVWTRCFMVDNHHDPHNVFLWIRDLLRYVARYLRPFNQNSSLYHFYRRNLEVSFCVWYVLRQGTLISSRIISKLSNLCVSMSDD